MVRLSPLDRKLLRDLWRMRGQALAIAAVVMGGVAILVMTLSTHASLVASRDRFYAEYRFADVFVSLKRAPESVAEQLSALPGVAAVETGIKAHARLSIPGFADPATALVLSRPETRPPWLDDIHIKRGRLLAPGVPDEVVVSDTLADAHGLAPGAKIDAIIHGRRQRLTVVGVAVSPEYVYQIAPGAMFPDFKRYGVLWMNRGALAAAYDLEGAFNHVALALTPDARLAEVIDGVDRVLARYGGRGAFGRADQFSNRFLSEELAQLETTATIFPAIFLGVAAFLLNVVLSRLVRLERGNIAILEAFGYGPLSIGMHYAKFTAAVVLLGIVAGSFLGAWFGHGLASVYRETTFRFPTLEYRLDAASILIGAAAAAASGAIGTALALAQAMRLSPAEGMRPEAPPVYRPTWLERWGLQRRLSVPTRMILRHIERRPVRSALTVLGLASGCALMMVGNYQKGAIDFMVDLQFRQAAREDVSVTFVEPTAERALHELAALPGVLRAEGYREVPVVLRHGPYRYRTSLVGIEPDGQLRRVLNTRLSAVRVPAGGVVLTEHLARNVLHVAPGEMLTIEVLEGRKPVLAVPLLGITQQYLGLSAYMERASLNALLHEGPAVSGAYLAVTRGIEQSLWPLLEARPRVAALVIKEAAVKSFYASMGEFVLFYTFVATLLAGAIALGVVYNAARITLSEHERELASLRVLGFTRGEIAYILLGELALLTLLALPIGFFLGNTLVAIVVWVFENDLYRLPFVLLPSNYALGAGVVLVAAFLSGWVLWWRVGRLDLLAVLKTRD